MDLETTLKGIQKHRDNIHRENYWDSPEDLSGVMTKLAVYNSTLAEAIAGLHKLATETEIVAYLGHKEKVKTVSEAKLLAKQDALNAREDYENAKLVQKATGDLINVIQSRLKIIGDKIRRGA